MQDISIASAHAADLEAMVDLLCELFTQEQDFRPDRDKQRRGLQLILETPVLGQLFVLRADGQVAGMANLLFTVSTAEGSRVAILEDVIVAAPWRGRGCGRRLLEHVVAWAADAGLARITLLTDADNYRAQATYGRMGFSPSAMRVMRRSLP